jgi:hypothetical protein
MKIAQKTQKPTRKKNYITEFFSFQSPVLMGNFGAAKSQVINRIRFRKRKTVSGQLDQENQK